MKKEIRNLISEAFNEVYQEVIAEGELNDKQKTIAQEIISKAKKFGGNSGLSHSTPQNKEQQDIFNYVIDELISNYRQTKNPNIKNAIQVAFYPTEGSPLYWRISKAYQGGESKENIKDALMTTYSNEFINNFDDTINQYKTNDGSFGGLVFNILKKRTINYLKGYIGSGGSEDVLGGRMGKSLETPIGGTEITLGDKLASSKQGDISSRFNDEDDIRKKMLVDMISWLKDNVTEMQYIAFIERIKGNSPEEIAEKYPDIFPDSPSLSSKKRVSKSLSDIKKGKLNQAAKFVSNKYKTPFNVNDINWKNFRQTISKKPEYSHQGKKTIIDNPEIKNAKKELSDIFKELSSNELVAIGVKTANDFKSGKQIQNIVQKLISLNKDDIADNIEVAWENIKKAKNNSSEYNKRTQFVDNADEEDFGGMFEGVDSKKLLERIMKRVLNN